MKKKRDSYLAELKDLSKHRRKEPELQNLRSQIDGLEHRLRYSTKDKETTVSQFQFTVISHAHCYSCLCPYLLLFQAPLNTLSNFLCCGSYLVIQQNKPFTLHLLISKSTLTLKSRTLIKVGKKTQIPSCFVGLGSLSSHFKCLNRGTLVVRCAQTFITSKLQLQVSFMHSLHLNQQACFPYCSPYIY